MEEAIGGTPAMPFRIPSNVLMARIDADSGLLPAPQSERIIVEAFKRGTEPTRAGAVSAAGRGGSRRRGAAA